MFSLIGIALGVVRNALGGMSVAKRAAAKDAAPAAPAASWWIAPAVYKYHEPSNVVRGHELALVNLLKRAFPERADLVVSLHFSGGMDSMASMVSSIGSGYFAISQPQPQHNFRALGCRESKRGAYWMVELSATFGSEPIPYDDVAAVVIGYLTNSGIKRNNIQINWHVDPA